MNNTMKKLLILGISFLLFGSTASATLIDRGGGLIYDTDLDITWLQDANYAGGGDDLESGLFMGRVTFIL